MDTFSNSTENAPSSISSTIGINGMDVTIRPIQRNDHALEASFIDNLSIEAKHYRFMGGVNNLPDQAIENLCNVDYRDSMAFVAVIRDKDSQREIGVVRYHKDNDENQHEMAIAVADDFRNTDLAAVLVQKLIDYGCSHGVEKLYSVELYDNPLMHEIAEQFSMEKTADPEDSRQVIYSMKL